LALGAKQDGYQVVERINALVPCQATQKIRMNADGFNGTVGIGWGDDFLSLMRFKSSAGVRSRGMQGKFGQIVSRVISRAGLYNGRHFYSGRTILLFRQVKPNFPYPVDEWTQVPRSL
jgi:hypothetical protein